MNELICEYTWLDVCAPPRYNHGLTLEYIQEGRVITHIDPFIKYLTNPYSVLLNEIVKKELMFLNEDIAFKFKVILKITNITQNEL